MTVETAEKVWLGFMVLDLLCLILVAVFVSRRDL